MKGQSYDILEPFSETELKRTTFEKIGLISFWTLLGSGGLSILFPERLEILHYFLFGIAVLAFVAWIISMLMSFISIEGRKIDTIGNLTFSDDVLVVLDKQYLYEDIVSADFILRDYYGQIKNRIGDNLFARSAVAQGGYNYFTFSTEEGIVKVRLRVKSKSSMEHLTEKIKPWLRKKITCANNH